MQELKAGELRTPGIIRMLSGRLIDLRNLQEDDIHIEDIAWGLGRTLRYGGHIRENYTVAHHSVVMSYMVPEEYQLEALLHDAAEGYVGDIIWPVKAMFPEIEKFECQLAMKIMDKYAVLSALVDGDHEYVKSPPVDKADTVLFQHECFSMGRPGVFDGATEHAWLKAASAHEQWWHESTYAFLERFDQLTGGDYLNLERLSELWFPNDSYSDEIVSAVEESVKEMLNAKAG